MRRSIALRQKSGRNWVFDMALDVAVGSFGISTSAAGATVEVNASPSVSPKAAIFWWTGNVNATDSASSHDHSRGIGFTTGCSGSYGIVTRSMHNAPTGDTLNAQRASAVFTYTTAPAVEGAADLASLDADGFTLSITNDFPNNYQIHYLVLGGSDITDVASGSFIMNTAVGEQEVAVGFNPDIVILLSSTGISTLPRVSTGEGLSFGAMKPNGEQAVLMGHGRDVSATMDTYYYCNDLECMAVPVNNGTLSSRHSTASAWVSNGFTINRLEGTLAYNVFYLAIKGGQWDIGSASTQTDTTTAITCTTGFQTRGAMICSSASNENAQDAAGGDDRWTMGAFQAASSRVAGAILDQDGVADSIVTTAVQYDSVYINLADGGTVQGLMDVASIGATGFDLIMTDADPVRSFFWWLAVGANAVVSGSSYVIPRRSRTYIRR